MPRRGRPRTPPSHIPPPPSSRSERGGGNRNAGTEPSQGWRRPRSRRRSGSSTRDGAAPPSACLAPYSPSAKEAAFAGLLIAVAGFFSFSQNLVVDGFGECTEMASFSGKNERGEMMNLISNAFFCSRFVTFLAMPRGLVRSRLPSKKNIHISSDVAEPAVASAPADAPGPRGKHRYRQILMTSGCERRRDGTRRTE